MFGPPRLEQLERIPGIELGMMQQGVLETAKGRFPFRLTPRARELLLGDGRDRNDGASRLKRAMERHVADRPASLLASGQVCLGEVNSIDWDGHEMGLPLLKQAEVALVPMVWPAPQKSTESAAARLRMAVTAPGSGWKHVLNCTDAPFASL